MECWGVPGSAPCAVLPKTRLSSCKWSSWVRGLWFIVFNLSWADEKKKRNLAVGFTTSHNCLSISLPPLLIMIEDEARCLRSDVEFCSVFHLNIVRKKETEEGLFFPVCRSMAFLF